MIYVVSTLAGIINGLFASGAGQMIVFLLIYILRIETHKARATSVFLIGITTIITFIRYIAFVKLDLVKIITVAIVGISCGWIGSKLMKKIEANYLNLISGILVTVFAICRLIK